MSPPRIHSWPVPLQVSFISTVSRVIATLAFRRLEIPCVRYDDDSGMTPPTLLVSAAPSSLAKFDELSLVVLKKKEAEAATNPEFLGLTIGFREDCGEVAASTSLQGERIDKIARMARDLRGKGAAPVACPQKFA